MCQRASWLRFVASPAFARLALRPKNDCGMDSPPQQEVPFAGAASAVQRPSVLALFQIGLVDAMMDVHGGGVAHRADHLCGPNLGARGVKVFAGDLTVLAQVPGLPEHPGVRRVHPEEERFDTGAELDLKRETLRWRLAATIIGGK